MKRNNEANLIEECMQISLRMLGTRSFRFFFAKILAKSPNIIPYLISKKHTNIHWRRSHCLFWNILQVLKDFCLESQAILASDCLFLILSFH